MKKNKFEGLSLEELQSKQMNARKVMIVLAIVMTVVNLLLVFMIFKTKLYSLFAVVVSSMMTLLPSFINLAQLHEEIKSRQSQN